jgi:hypothetical protein
VRIQTVNALTGQVMGGAQRTAVSRGGQTRQGTEFSGSCSTSASGSAARLFAPYVLGRICYLLAGGVAGAAAARGAFGCAHCYIEHQTQAVAGS